jgi:hypothetical protein
MQTKELAWENEKRPSANTSALRYHAITLVDPRAGRRSLSPGRGVHPDVAIWRPGTGSFPRPLTRVRRGRVLSNPGTVAVYPCVQRGDTSRYESF